MLAFFHHFTKFVLHRRYFLSNLVTDLRTRISYFIFHISYFIFFGFEKVELNFFSHLHKIYTNSLCEGFKLFSKCFKLFSFSSLPNELNKEFDNHTIQSMWVGVKVDHHFFKSSMKKCKYRDLILT